MAEAMPEMLDPVLDPQALWTQLRRDWLISEERSSAWFEEVCDRCRQLESCPQTSASALVLIAEPDGATFLASFLAALLAGWSVAFANPNWGLQEWQSASELISPDIIWGETIGSLDTSLTKSLILSEPAIFIPTGGSSGQIKFAHHTWASLMASVSGFRQFFTPDGRPVNTCCVLPVYHVSGLMQILRAWASNGQVRMMPFKQLEAAELIANHSQDWFISLVPTQLERLIHAGKGSWLSQFRAVLLGGAPAWLTLLEKAKSLNIPLCLSYGMTETAAMVSALSPEDFLQGCLSSGRSLPHATIQVFLNGQAAAVGEVGVIAIRSAALAKLPSDPLKTDTPDADIFYTDDLGYLDDSGHLHITGRASGKIISGGENIFPAEVEAALRSTGQVKDVCILGLPHPQWGEVVAAAYVPANENVCPKSLKLALMKPSSAPFSTNPAYALSRYKHPKYWIPFTALPRNTQGKLNRRALRAQVTARIAHLSNPLGQTLAGGDA